MSSELEEEIIYETPLSMNDYLLDQYPFYPFGICVVFFNDVFDNPQRIKRLKVWFWVGVIFIFLCIIIAGIFYFAFLTSDVKLLNEINPLIYLISGLGSIAWFVRSKAQHLLDQRKKWPSAHLFWNADLLVESRDPSWLSHSFWNKKYKKAIDDSKKNIDDERNIREKAEKYLESDPWLSLDDNSIEWLKNLSKSDENNGLIIKWFFNPPEAPLISNANKNIVNDRFEKYHQKAREELRQIVINEIEGMESQTAKDVLDKLEGNDTYLFEDEFKVWKKSPLRSTEFSRLLEG